MVNYIEPGKKYFYTNKWGEVFEEEYFVVDCVTSNYVVFFDEKNKYWLETLEDFTKNHTLAPIETENGEIEEGCVFLEANSFGLFIKVEGKNGLVLTMGIIDNSGKCYIQNNEYLIENTKYWKKMGKKINSTSVEWKGCKYEIDDDYCLSKKYRTSAVGVRDVDQIWDLEYMKPLECEDSNIQKNEFGVPYMYSEGVYGE